jgi:hypothetical protein
MKKYILALCFFTTANAFAQDIKISKEIKKAMDHIDTNTIRSHVAYLADDKLKGRLPGTEGFQMAVDYVIDNYKKIGIQPGGDNGGYTQKLVIRRSQLDKSSAIAVLKDKNGNNDTLSLIREYTPTPHPLSENAAAQG